MNASNERQRWIRLVGLLAVALATSACTASAFAEGVPSSTSQAAAARPAATATPAPTVSPRQVLARHAAAYITTVLAYDQRDPNAALRPDVCSATFAELEFFSRQASAYQAEPVLSNFVTSAASISLACEFRRVPAIRQGVQALADLSGPLASLGG